MGDHRMNVQNFNRFFIRKKHLNDILFINSQLKVRFSENFKDALRIHSRLKVLYDQNFSNSRCNENLKNFCDIIARVA